MLHTSIGYPTYLFPILDSELVQKNLEKIIQMQQAHPYINFDEETSFFSH